MCRRKRSATDMTRKVISRVSQAEVGGAHGFDEGLLVDDLIA